MKISRQEFIDLVGEDPVDILGDNWEDYVQDYLMDNDYVCPECGHTPETGACFYCKQD